MPSHPASLPACFGAVRAADDGSVMGRLGDRMVARSFVRAMQNLARPCPERGNCVRGTDSQPSMAGRQLVPFPSSL